MKQITTPLDSPLEGAPRTVSYLWMFPGMVGTQANPLPSGYATVPQVVELCCGIFERYGRECDAYRRTKRVRKLPKITPDLLTSAGHDQRRVNIMSDLRRMICYLVRKHCRWMAHPSKAPRMYEFRFLATHLSMGRSGAVMAYHRAECMIGVDACFTDLYSTSLQELCAEFTVHLDRFVGDVGMPVGEVAA